MPRIHRSKKWKLKRDEFIKDKKCEWCGSLEHLSIHHVKPHPIGLDAYKIVARNFFDDYYSERKNQQEFKMLLVKAHEENPPKKRFVCPRCKKASYNERKIKKPKYHCNRCRYEFETLEHLLIPVSEHRIINKIRFYFENDHREEIKAQFEEYKKIEQEKYLDFENSDVMILCRKCHYHAGQGQVLCSICKERYHKKKYSTCFECAVKKRPELEKYRGRRYAHVTRERM